jgi:hypothetical protein
LCQNLSLIVPKVPTFIAQRTLFSTQVEIQKSEIGPETPFLCLQVG